MSNGEGSWIRVNRLKDCYTWAVTVAAKDESVEAVRAAKEHALELTRELEAELGVVKPTKEVAF